MRFFLPWLLILCASCRLAAQEISPVPPASASSSAAARPAIESLLQTQADAWNRGDIDAFMEGYAKTPDLRFASGATVTRGWQETLDRYRHHYPDRAEMGTLTFSDLDTTVLSSDAAVVFGRWRVKTQEHGEPNGLFTLVLRRTADGWRITADHTSMGK